MYSTVVDGDISLYNLHYQLKCDFLKIVQYWYSNEMPDSCSHVNKLSQLQEHEFATLYTNDFENWKQEHNIK